ncbi:K(+) efflux antiporter 6-like [Asparagus officinalis]|uniref:K(+) efflux antiporter 6-like n=1 Tax=Asparagus officinalis TaxID=4686 RepID=UPI00098E31D6|nr:K(+) efflux antiporter 6-like [Asparagus officinalis]
MSRISDLLSLMRNWSLFQVITGYLLAGSLIGPGGLNFVSEMVQVETVAQFGVIFLLFALGLEFSTTKLRVVRTVAVLGGLLQNFLFMCLCGIIASEVLLYCLVSHLMKSI